MMNKIICRGYRFPLDSPQRPIREGDVWDGIPTPEQRDQFGRCGNSVFAPSGKVGIRGGDWAVKISDGTIKVRLKAILKKIHVQTRTQAAIWALNHGFARDLSSSAQRAVTI
jgi:hypothetical protein